MSIKPKYTADQEDPCKVGDRCLRSKWGEGLLLKCVTLEPLPLLWHLKIWVLGVGLWGLHHSAMPSTLGECGGVDTKESCDCFTGWGILIKDSHWLKLYGLGKFPFTVCTGLYHILYKWCREFTIWDFNARKKKSLVMALNKWALWWIMFALYLYKLRFECNFWPLFYICLLFLKKQFDLIIHSRFIFSWW